MRSRELVVEAMVAVGGAVREEGRVFTGPVDEQAGGVSRLGGRRNHGRTRLMCVRAGQQKNPWTPSRHSLSLFCPLIATMEAYLLLTLAGMSWYLSGSGKPRRAAAVPSRCRRPW